MNEDQLRAGLVAIRAQVDSLLYALAPPETLACSHPENQREDRSVMGKPERWACRVCGYEHDEG